MPTLASVRAAVMVLVVVLFAGTALAQIDAQSQPLLDSIMQAEQDAPIVSIDQTMTTTSYADGQEYTSTTRMVIDYANRRAVMFMDMGGGTFVRLVHLDGATTMHMTGMPMAMPVPPEMAGSFDGIFDQTDSLSQDPNAIAVYDGDVSYGDVIAGRQVTYTATYDFDGEPQTYTTRFIFDGAGAFIGQVTVGDDGTLYVMVFDGPAIAAGYGVRDSTMYQFDAAGQVGTLMAKTVYENVAIDQPLDESVFE